MVCRKTIRVTAASAALITLTTACGRATTPANNVGTTTPPGSARTATNDVQIFSWWTAGGEADGLNALLKVFQKQYPQYHVVNQAVAGGAGSNAKAVLASRMTANQPPDTFQAHADQELDAYVYANKMSPIDNLYKSQGWYSVFPKVLIQDLTVNGHVYAVPVDVHRGNVLWYNPGLFKKYNLSPPKTFNDFFKVANVFKSHGITTLALGDTDTWEATMLWENVLLGTVGANTYNQIWHGKVALDSPGVKQSVNTFVKMLAYVNSNHSALQWQDASGMVGKGQAAMNLMGDWAKGYFTSINLKPTTGFGWAPFPGTQNDFEFITDVFGLPKGAPNPAGAQAFLKVLGSKAGQEAFNPKKGSIAARTDVNPNLFDVYSKQAMVDFKKDMLVPSLAHGEAANPAFLTAVNNAVQVLVTTKNTNQFISALKQAAQTNPLK